MRTLSRVARSLLFLAACTLIFAAPVSFAAGSKGAFQNLIGPPRAKLGSNGNVVVTFNLLGNEPASSPFSGTPMCHYQIWTDLGGTRMHWDFNDSAKPMFPKHPTAVFTKAGHTSVSVVAVGDTGCGGGVQTWIDIDPPATPAPSCPPGWNLASKNDQTGGFRCTPVKPSAVPCPVGTTWFDEGGSVGCKP